MVSMRQATGSLARQGKYTEPNSAEYFSRTVSKPNIKRKPVYHRIEGSAIDIGPPEACFVPAFRIKISELARPHAVVIGELIAGQSSPFSIGVFEKIDREDGSILVRKMIGRIDVMQRKSARSEQAIRFKENVAQHVPRDVFEDGVRDLDVDASVRKTGSGCVAGCAIIDVCPSQYFSAAARAREQLQTFAQPF